MAKGGNRGKDVQRRPETAQEHERDYAVARDPDIRGVNRGRREAEEYRDTREGRG